MDSPSSANELTTRPEGITKLNDSVWEFQRPNGPPEVDVIFLHGLQFFQKDLSEANWKTWVSRDGTTVWPKHWLGTRFPRARIWSISYHSLALKCIWGNDPQLNFNQIIENLLQDLLSEGAGQQCPVIMVGHSLGGIVIKSLIIKFVTMQGLHQNSGSRLGRQITTFLHNCKGVFFYSTPFGGSNLGNWLARFPRQNEPIVKLLKVFSSETAVMNQDFGIYRRNNNITAQMIHEGLETKYGGFKAKVVLEGSARNDVDRFFTAAHANHFDVCKPVTETDSSYLQLRDFIRETMEDAGANLTEMAEDASQYIR